MDKHNELPLTWLEHGVLDVAVCYINLVNLTPGIDCKPEEESTTSMQLHVLLLLRRAALPSSMKTRTENSPCWRASSSATCLANTHRYLQALYTRVYVGLVETRKPRLPDNLPGHAGGMVSGTECFLCGVRE